MFSTPLNVVNFCENLKTLLEKKIKKVYSIFRRIKKFQDTNLQFW